MRKQYCLLLCLLLAFVSCGQAQSQQGDKRVGVEINKLKTDKMKLNKLNTEEERVIINKGTETPFTGELLDNKEKGTYVCKHCNAPLYSSGCKFDSGCGWPSFDDALPAAVTRTPDADGRRTEITCANCGGHLGHVFLGEGHTEKNTRHCVNSVSMMFLPERLDTAYLASGCFWGTEHFMMKALGVVKTSVGFMGGHVNNPTYEEVCTKTTGHVEVCEVVFDANLTTYDKLVKLYFETHDFTQIDGQGPDIGPQYRSVIFYTSEEQKEIAENNKQILSDMGNKVATEILKASIFWKAEDYHQQYYKHKGSSPYCHTYKKIFP
ncbi:peptide methionine sulfoxide reductase MsrA [Bacteroidales bacterium]|nr:peptide methionine sulfoxide reductase MsrA [Bacteroidales bacterium]